MQHLTDYYILYLLLICRIFLKYGTGNVMNNKMEDYFASLYKMDANSRLFPVTKYYLHHELDRGCKSSGVKRFVFTI